MSTLDIDDVVHQDQLQTGVRREGMFFRMNGFAIRFGVSVQALIPTQTLRLTGYVPDLPAQPASVLADLRLLLTAVPIAALAIWAYPLYGERPAQVKARVAQLHEEKAAARVQ